MGGHVASLFRIADDDPLEHDRPAGAGGEAFGLFEDQFRHAAADRAAADQSDSVQGPWGILEGAGRVRDSSPFFINRAECRHGRFP